MGECDIEVEHGAIRTTVETRRGEVTGLFAGAGCGIVAFVAALAWLPRQIIFLPVALALAVVAGKVVARVIYALLDTQQPFVLDRSGVRLGDRRLSFAEAVVATRATTLPYEVHQLLTVTAARAKAKRAFLPLEDLLAMQRFLEEGLRGSMEVAAWALADRSAKPGSAGPRMTLTITNGRVTRAELAGDPVPYESPAPAAANAKAATYTVPTRFEVEQGRGYLKPRLQQASRAGAPEIDISAGATDAPEGEGP